MQCCRLAAYLHKINLHDTGLCSHCLMPETVAHFLLECTSTLKLRTKIQDYCQRSGSSYDIRTILSNISLCDLVYCFCIENQILI